MQVAEFRGSEGNSGRFYDVPFHTALYKGCQTSLWIFFETDYNPAFKVNVTRVIIGLELYSIPKTSQKCNMVKEGYSGRGRLNPDRR